MPDTPLSIPLLPPWLKLQLRSLWDRDRDPFLDGLRWRLHLRLLLLSALLTTAFFFVNLSRGRVDEVGLGVPASLAAWAWVRRHPQHSRTVARLMLSFFLCLGIYSVFLLQTPGIHWALLAMMIFTVFGTLLDGMVGGGLAAGITVATGLVSLAIGRTFGLPLVTAFATLSTVCFYLTCLAHTWMFNRLVAHRRECGRAIACTSALAEQLASTLNQDVAAATARLRASLSQGLAGLAQAGELQRLLAQARAKLPAELPRSAVVPSQLLDSLRHGVHRVFLGLALMVAVLATAIVVGYQLPHWQLAAMVAIATAMLLWLGDQYDPRWHWRLHAFLAICLASILMDVLLTAEHPPADSLVFLPLIVFFAGMLAPPLMAYLVGLAGVGLLALAFRLAVPAEGQGVVLVILGLLALTMAVISHLTALAYHDLLKSMLVEEEELRQSLGAYRRMVSTLFHDLANPLAVLQTLAAMPPSLLTQDDEARASRMLLRLESVAGRARAAAQADAGANTNVALLASELYDLFRDRLRDKALLWQLDDGSAIPLKRGGGLLRDLMLGHLLSNAVKYSPQGGVIRLSARVQDPWLILTLQDQGPGYPAQVLHDIAAGLSPPMRPGTQGELGHGYGLLEASASAHELGGKLVLRNAPGGGAEAELWLPQGQLDS